MSVEEQIRPLVDPEWDLIIKQIEALDQYLQVQNLRRREEEYLIRLIERGEVRPGFNENQIFFKRRRSI